MHAEQKAVLLLLAALIAESSFPILSKYTVGFISPVFLGAVMYLIAFVPVALLLIKRSSLGVLWKKEFLPYFLGIGFFGSFFYGALLLYGASLTSGINTALLQQTELIFSIILSYLVLRERITMRHVLAAVMVFLGVCILVYKGTPEFNIGDFLLMLAPLGLQLSYILTKKIIGKVGIFPIMGARFLYGGAMLLFLSTVFNTNEFTLLAEPAMLGLVALLSIVAILTILPFFEALKSINLSKATYIMAPYPAVSILLAWVFLNETPAVYHVFGTAAIVAGLSLAVAGAYVFSTSRSALRGP